jgi:hypothetical protein
MPKKPRKPFEVKLSKDERDDLALDLSRALDDALSARSASESEIQYWHTLYEQGRTRSGNNAPWADAADLTSYLGTQYVDVMRSQIVRTVMTEPVFTVEGYGQAAAKAPFVEEFHQWQIETEGFQQVFSRAVHLALIEPRGVIEVYEDTIRRPVRKTIQAKLALAPDGTALVGPDLKPELEMGPDGQYAEATTDLQPGPDGQPVPPVPSAEVEVDSFETVADGPRERVVPGRDYVQLPGHARDKAEVWGHAKRFYRRVEELKERVKAGHYDKEAVEDLGTDDERVSETTLAGDAIPVASKDGTDRVEKELWELLFLRELDGKGLRWFVATLHKDKQRLLRLQYDDIGRPRYFPLVPFPRPHSTEGYSYVGHKLITVIEEHTAWRNMLADRASMQLQAPMMRQQGALWDPDSEPIGPKAIIPFRQRGEVEPMQIPDATGPAIERIRDAERSGERLSGVNDASAGVTSQESRTLGEVQLITQQSMGRITEAVKNIQETLEELCQVRHLMHKRRLAEMDGLEAPPSVLQGLELRGADVSYYLPNAKFTATMFDGAFRFKPRGSVENADPGQQRQEFAQSMQAMAQLSQANPMIAAILQTPGAAKALIEQWCRLFNVQDKQAFLGSEAQAAMQQAMQQIQMQQQMAAMGGPPGGPPGAHPSGPPPPMGPPS